MLVFLVCWPRRYFLRKFKRKAWHYLALLDPLTSFAIVLSLECEYHDTTSFQSFSDDGIMDSQSSLYDAAQGNGFTKFSSAIVQRKRLKHLLSAFPCFVQQQREIFFQITRSTYSPYLTLALHLYQTHGIRQTESDTRQAATRRAASDKFLSLLVCILQLFADSWEPTTYTDL